MVDANKEWNTPHFLPAIYEVVFWCFSTLFWCILQHVFHFHSEHSIKHCYLWVIMIMLICDLLQLQAHPIFWNTYGNLRWTVLPKCATNAWNSMCCCSLEVSVLDYNTKGTRFFCLAQGVKDKLLNFDILSVLCKVWIVFLAFIQHSFIWGTCIISYKLSPIGV